MGGAGHAIRIHSWHGNIRRKSDEHMSLTRNAAQHYIPGNKGSLFSNSPKIHPTDHMSMPKLYCLAPKSKHGARYHNVTTDNTAAKATREPVLSAVVATSTGVQPDIKTQEAKERPRANVECCHVQLDATQRER